MGLLTLFGDFANWGTVVGIPHIANARNIKWRIFWGIVFLILLGVFIYELYLMISTLLSYPSAVSTEIHYEEQRFPVVTICPQNPYKKSVVYNSSNPDFTAMNAMLTAYHQGAVRSLSNSTPDQYGFSTVQQDDYMLNWYGNTWLMMLAAQMTPAQLQPASYSYYDWIGECSFNGMPCDDTAFTPFMDPVYGQCYSFNNDAKLNYSTNRAGLRYGLKLIATPTQAIAAPGSPQDYLPTTWLAGARVFIGSIGDYPQMFGAGMDVPVGSQAVIAMSPSQIFRAPPPCGECDDNPNKPNYYPNYTYTMETCFDTCRQVNTQKACGCSNPRYAKKSTDTYCKTLADVQCMATLQGDQANKGAPNPDLSQTCGCTPPCSEYNYGVTMSLAKFPAESYNVVTGNNNIPPCDGKSAPFGSDKTSCRQWYMTNALQILVYFESLKYEKYTEDCSYGIQDLINDLGGHAGLWLGLSVISVVEVLGLIFLLLCYCVSGGKYNLRPSETEYSMDDRIQDCDDMDRELDEKDRYHENLRNNGEH